MTFNFYTLKNLLSHKFVTIIIIVVCCLGRITQKLAFTSIDDDKSYQLQATGNFLKGEGLTIHKIAQEDYSVSYYEPLIKWPPAFSILNAPFQAFSGSRWLWGTVLLDIIICVLFIFLARKLMWEAAQPPWAINLFTIVAGFYLYDFANSNSTDFLALVTYLGAVIFTLRYLRTSTTGSWVGIALCLLLTALTRYMYLPVIFIIPLFLVMTGFVHRNRIHRNGGLSMILVLSLALAAYLLWQKEWGGQATYIAPSEKGIYLKNITKMSPFLFTTFGHVALPLQWISNTFEASYREVARNMAGAHLFIFLIAFLLSSYYFLRTIKQDPKPRTVFYQLGFLSVMAVVATLTFLSLTNAPLRVLKDNEWTFLVEVRYYAVPVFFTQAILYTVLIRALEKKVFRRWVILLLFLPLMASTFHGIYFTVKSVFNGNLDYRKKPLVHSLASATQVVNDIREAKLLRKSIVASGDPMFNNYYTLSTGEPTLFSDTSLNSLPDGPNKMYPVIIVVRWWFEKDLQPLLNHPLTRFYRETNGFKIFVYEPGGSPATK